MMKRKRWLKKKQIREIQLKELSISTELKRKKQESLVGGNLSNANQGIRT